MHKCMSCHAVTRGTFQGHRALSWPCHIHTASHEAGGVGGGPRFADEETWARETKVPSLWSKSKQTVKPGYESGSPDNSFRPFKNDIYCGCSVGNKRALEHFRNFERYRETEEYNKNGQPVSRHPEATSPERCVVQASFVAALYRAVYTLIACCAPFSLLTYQEYIMIRLTFKNEIFIVFHHGNFLEDFSLVGRPGGDSFFLM